MGKRSLNVPIDKKVRRILYVAYPLLPVTNESCGGAEQMLSVVEAEMADRGHFTTVAACAESQVRGVVFSTGRETTEPDHFIERDAEHQARILDLLQKTTGSQPTFDLVHDKSGSFWRRAAESDVPVLATLHLPRHFYPGESFRNLPPNLYFNCVSDAQSQSFASVKNVMSVVQNGIQAKQFPFKQEKEDYLLWMGRVCEEKGPHIAIQVAQRSGLPLVLAGQVYPFSYHQLFYNAKIRPHLGGKNPPICFIETPTLETKLRLLSNARAVLVPSLVEETSSLVAMEAMACGTPVIGFRCGAIPEVVVDQLTGLVVDEVDRMVEAVWQVGDINPYACRVHVETNYSASRMADDYEKLYERVLALDASRTTTNAA
jgi:glycosyltransferase involved in cell wall biosynthesis